MDEFSSYEWWPADTGLYPYFDRVNCAAGTCCSLMLPFIKSLGLF
jgi:hypothetical protein